MLNLGEVGQQIIFFSAIIFAFVFWIWGKIRYDLVALISLAIIVLGGVISFDSAFLGFSSPVVIIVASVLVMSRGIINTGFIDYLLNKIPIKNKDVSLQILILTSLTALISAFVYNIGAMAIIMPLAISIARKNKTPVAYYLMPIAFAAHMGGFLTLIGNAPNIIVSSFRNELIMQPFSMFDFSKIGIFIVVVSLIFISTIGWRLIPKIKKKVDKQEISNISSYNSELLVTKDSGFINKTIKEFKKEIKEKFTVCAVIRNKNKIIDLDDEIILENDLILINADAQTIRTIISLTKFKLNTPKEKEGQPIEKQAVEVEAVVGPNSKIIGLTLHEMRIDMKYDVEVVAISRHDQEIKKKIKDVKIKSGDILLLKGKEDDIDNFLSKAKLLPLAERYINLQPSTSMAGALLIFLTSILLTVFNVLPVEISFFLGAIFMAVLGIITAKQIYQNIDWPIIILLGAMIPFGEAIITSGVANLISSSLLALMFQVSPIMILAVVLFITIIMSDFINNVGVAVLMAPISIIIAQSINVSVDPFLMAVAIGGSCAFLTPVGHQVNLLVMEPGGYKFTDYWKMGLFLNMIVFVIAIILLPIIWPF